VALSVAQARDDAPQCHGTTAWMGHLQALDSSLKMEVRRAHLRPAGRTSLQHFDGSAWGV